MKQEGFVNGALNIIKRKDLSARWLANQSGFNSPDSTIDPSYKAAVVVALNVYNDEILVNELDSYIQKANDTNNVGEINNIIDTVLKLIRNAGKSEELNYPE